VKREWLHGRVRALIDRLADGSRDDAARDELLRDLLRFQRRAVLPYARIVEAMGEDHADPLRWPGVPTDVFRFTRVAAHAAGDDLRVFRSSGTSSQARSEHHLRELSLYDHAAQTAARHALFPDRKRMPLLILASSVRELADSSLSYMLERFVDWFGAAGSSHLVAGGQLDVDRLEHALAQGQAAGQPLALLGTSFAFVHAEDALGSRRFALCPGSRIMQTGGFKGRSREVEPPHLLQLLASRYGVPEAFIVQEYGMTELSSQCYETSLRDALLGLPPGPRRMWVPGWLRASLIDPNTLAAVPEGEEGLLRIDDPCNLDTACAIQSADRARALGDGIVVLGRASGASARGCSIAADAALSSGTAGRS
jgi:hypothetical protein